MMKFIVIILAIYSLVSFSCKQLGEGETYLIPKGYKGRVFIFFNQKNGTPMERDKNNFRIYRINRNGVLKTQFDANKGEVFLSNIKYYYVDTIKGSKEELKCHLELIRGDSLGVFLPKDGSIGNLLWSEFIVDSSQYVKKYDFGKVNIKDVYNSQ